MSDKEMNTQIIHYFLLFLYYADMKKTWGSYMSRIKL